MSIADTFSINPIKPSMSHAERVYEYARRISHYSLLASEERKMSKIFDCSMIDENHSKCGERCGCAKRDSILRRKEMSANPSRYLPDQRKYSFCESCEEATNHYQAYRDAVSKKAAALRQLNNEMIKNGFFTSIGVI